MRVTNKTTYDTRAFKRLCAEVARRGHLEPEHLRRVTCTLVYGRRAGVSGCARLHGDTMRVRVPRHGAGMVALAWLIAHEFAHLRGLHHKAYRRGWGERYTAMHPDINKFTVRSREMFAWAAAVEWEVSAVRCARTVGAIAAGAES